MPPNNGGIDIVDEVVSAHINNSSSETRISSPVGTQWFRVQFGPILFHAKIIFSPIKIVSYGQIWASRHKLFNIKKKLLHLLSQGYACIFCLLFCLASVNSHHPIGKKIFRRHALFFGGGYIESDLF